MLGILLCLALAQPAAPVAPDTAAARPDSVKAAPPSGEHGLGEEVISGKAEMNITDTKTFFAPQLDPFTPIDRMLVPESYVFDDALYRTVDSLTIPSQFISSSFIRVPVERDFIYGDIMVFLPTFEKRVATWELVVANSLGETVRRVKQKGQPPAVISRDGRTDSGEPIITGEIYSFTFNAYDAHGNQTRTPVSPQRMGGIVYEQDGARVISMAADLVFSGDGTQLHEGAGRRLDEVANIIKRDFRKEVVVYVFSEQEQLSAARCAALLGELKSRTVLPPEALKVAPRFIPGLKPKFSKVEVHVR